MLIDSGSVFFHSSLQICSGEKFLPKHFFFTPTLRPLSLPCGTVIIILTLSVINHLIFTGCDNTSHSTATTLTLGWMTFNEHATFSLSLSLSHTLTHSLTVNQRHTLPVKSFETPTHSL